jgi:hypothetical protein
MDAIISQRCPADDFDGSRNNPAPKVTASTVGAKIGVECAQISSKK